MTSELKVYNIPTAIESADNDVMERIRTDLKSQELQRRKIKRANIWNIQMDVVIYQHNFPVTLSDR